MKNNALHGSEYNTVEVWVAITTEVENGAIF
jgi:hypothetical protein